jgi:hypothetical protein
LCDSIYDDREYKANSLYGDAARNFIKHRNKYRKNLNVALRDDELTDRDYSSSLATTSLSASC